MKTKRLKTNPAHTRLINKYKKACEAKIQELYTDRRIKKLSGVVIGSSQHGYPQLVLFTKDKNGVWKTKDGQSSEDHSRMNKKFDKTAAQFDEFLEYHMEEGNLDPEDLILIAERFRFRQITKRFEGV